MRPAAPAHVASPGLGPAGPDPHGVNKALHLERRAQAGLSGALLRPDVRGPSLGAPPRARPHPAQARPRPTRSPAPRAPAFLAPPLRDAPPSAPRPFRAPGPLAPPLLDVLLLLGPSLPPGRIPPALGAGFPVEPRR